MDHNYPDFFARFYDTIYDQLRNSVDHDFFLNQIRGSKGKVLEVGVGTGRFFIEALSEGADVYGIDTSESMLGVLKSKLDNAEHFRISQQNMVDFSFDFDFDLIIAPFRVIMHVISKEDQISALNNIYRHLKPGGRFVFDTFVPDLNQLLKGLDNKIDFEGEYVTGRRIRRIVSTKPDLIGQIINVLFRLEWDEEEELKTATWELPLRFFFRYELEHLMERSDFDSYKILGDYAGNNLSESSREFIVIGYKA